MTILHLPFACTPCVSAVVVGWTPYGVPMAGAIVAEGLRKNFGTVEALRGIDLDVASGTVFGFLGPNGAGKTTAGGMRRRLDVAASLVARPDVLFLDEPTTGLDPRSRIDLWAMIRELVHEGKTILLTTQYLEEADNLADRIAVVDLGTIIAEGTADELKDQIGGEVLELHVKDPAQITQVGQALWGVGIGEPSIDQEAGKIRIPVGADGPAALLDSVRRIDDMKLALEDIALHRPTLDDVFLSLTGHAAEEEQEEDRKSVV